MISMPTHLLYLEDFSVLSASATVLDLFNENNRDVILLDRTIFYPQGGGQPFDKGIIKKDSALFRVEEVRFVDGVVKHIGIYEHGQFERGDQVDCFVDPDRRALLSRIHSAGHVVDMAIVKLNLPWKPGKGYHFPDGPYIEYAGSLESLDKEKLKQDLEIICDEIIKQDLQTKLLFMNKSEMDKICHFVSDLIPANKPGRVVMFGDFGVPCGGTHVGSLHQIKSMSIRKIKADGPNIRIAYDVER